MRTTVHSNRPADHGPAADLERTATEWFFRRDRGFSSGDAAAFERWLRADERHARMFADIENTWREFGKARHTILAPRISRPAPVRRGRKRMVIPVVLAAAAALALAYVGVRRLATSPAVIALQAATEIGGLRKIDLPDGSFVTLNTNTAVDVHFTAAERRVRLLRGEAWFEVARDARRAFVVEANGVAVKAVGTAFNVRVHLENVEVLVTEGKVRVDDAVHGQSLLSTSPAAARSPDGLGSLERLLLRGEKVIIPVKTGAAPSPAASAALPAKEVELVLAWQNRRLSYVDAPLSEIVADFNRYNQHRLVIVDPRLAGTRFGGTFLTGDYRSLVQLLEKTFDVIAERREGDTVLRLP